MKVRILSRLLKNEKDMSEEVKFKYFENLILEDLKEYLKSTYGEHYKGDQIECFDAWMALGDATPTFRNTAIKYLWRYGKKLHLGSVAPKEVDKKDLLKAMHYIMMMLYNDFYRE